MPRYHPNTEIACRACGEPFVLSAHKASRYDYTCGRCTCARERAWLVGRGPRSLRPTRPQSPEYQRQRYQQSAELRHKASVQGKTRYAIKRGLLVRQPCEVCGAARADAHHDDYSRPLDVRWLCPLHHRRHHAALKRAV